MKYRHWKTPSSKPQSSRITMAIFNYKKREISAKIVYYGPALCGKTTNVQKIHNKLNPRQRGELVSLATDADRTLFFDFLPIELENVGGFKTRFQIYTVPGQVYYNSTRKAVLTGVDGVIFVADSQTSMEQENLESLNNLIDNLKYYNRDITQIPMIMQYNKRDLDNIMTMDELNSLLNQRKLPNFAASAVTGDGVLQALTACCKQVLSDLKKKSLRTSQAASGSTKDKTSPISRPLVNKATTPETSSHNKVETGPTANLPPFAFPETNPAQTAQAKTEVTPFSTSEPPFKPEITHIGKARLVNPHTITLPLRLATDSEQRKILSVDITFSIKDFIQT